ncbi:MAG TPA: hypothetical protein VFX67_11380 [Burkholderiales bacterium]|nr:hypothetical protein [Burkholderiales bacterium]
MLTGGLVGLALAVLLYFFEYASISRAQKERAARRKVRSVDMDQSERSRLRNLGWFCLVLPFAGAGAGWLLG